MHTSNGPRRTLSGRPSLPSALCAALLLAGCPAPKPRPAPPRRDPPRVTPPRVPPATSLLTGATTRYVGLGDLIPHDAALSPDGRLLAVGGQFARVDLYDLEAGRRLRTLGRGDELPVGIAVRFSADGKQLIGAGYKLRRAFVWDVATGRRLRRIQLTDTQRGAAVNTRIRALAVAPGGLLALGRDGGVELWDHRTGKLLQRLTIPYRLPPAALAFDARGARLALVTPAGDLMLYRTSDGIRLDLARLGQLRPASLVFGPKGEWLALGTQGGSVHLVRVKGLRQQRDFQWRDSSTDVVGVAFRSGGAHLLVAESGGTVHEVSMASGKTLTRVSVSGSGGVLAVATSPRRVALLGKAGNVALVSARGNPAARWSLAAPPRPAPPRPTVTLASPRILPLPRPPLDVVSWAIAKQGRQVVLGHRPLTLTAWWRGKKDRGPYQRRWLRRIQLGRAAAAGRPVRVALAPDERYVFSHGPTDQLQRFTAGRGVPMLMARTRARGLGSLLVTPDGRTVITTIHPGDLVRLWTEAGKPRGRFRGVKDPYWAGLSADGRLFVEIGGLDEIRVVDTKTRKQLWLHHSGGFRKREVLTLSFDPASKLLYSYHLSGFLRRYDARTGKLHSRHRIPAPDGARVCTLRPDCKVLACANGSTLHLTELPSGARLPSVTLPGSGAITGLGYGAAGKALLLQRGPRKLWVIRYP